MTNDTEKKIIEDWFAPMEFFGAEITNCERIKKCSCKRLRVIKP